MAAATFDVYERLLGMEETPWTQRLLDIRLKNKKAGSEARKQEGAGRVADTKPSHALADYVVEYDHPSYGGLKIGMKDNALQLEFHKIKLPLAHFHYDRFDTPDDEQDGKLVETRDPVGRVERRRKCESRARAIHVRSCAATPAAVRTARNG